MTDLCEIGRLRNPYDFIKCSGCSQRILWSDQAVFVNQGSLEMGSVSGLMYHEKCWEKKR